MIPSLILVGLVAGGFLTRGAQAERSPSLRRDRAAASQQAAVLGWSPRRSARFLRRPHRLAVVCAVASLVWGLAVGLAAGNAATFIGGTALAAVNVAIGAVVGAGVRKLFRASFVRALRA